MPDQEDSAPLPLRWVEELVNTYRVEESGEELTSPAVLVAWLAARELVAAGAAAGEEDLARARQLREGLRALIAANNGEAPATGEPAPAALAALAALAAELPVVLDPLTRPPRLVPAAPGTVDGALAQLLAGVAVAVADGSWARLKACREPTCRWAYYDNSRNRSRSWCSMAVCGNRNKARAFRRRAR